MTDERYVYKEDLKERKAEASGARHKNRRKSGCRLPSDSLTGKQKEKLNSEVRSYSLRKPMGYDEFMKLPDDLKKDYLQFLIFELNATAADVARMFGVSDFTVRSRAKEFCLSFPRSGRRTHQKFAFGRFLNADKEDAAAPAQDEEHDAHPEESETDAHRKAQSENTGTVAQEVFDEEGCVEQQAIYIHVGNVSDAIDFLTRGKMLVRTYPKVHIYIDKEEPEWLQ